ncbi:MAG TPA: urate hydroxylase PuuD [Gemmatimonadales bacterium]|nr:urate hydroxylase PuuD [Gemmatimonadales bacterium]
MMAGLTDWTNLLLRWAHFIAGIAWIGSSFYFIWLDRALATPAAPRPGVEGDLWMVHSGGFYQVEKRRPGPGEVPAVLHWFKWEALLTWITGISLLVLVYYLSGAYLLDPSVSRIGRGTATALGIGLLIAGWFFYDLLWRSPLAARRGVATTLSLVALAGVTFLLCRVFSGRAAFMHIGSLLGTIMVANVWLRILPAQHHMLAATRAGRPADFTLGERAKQRSLHNSYMTFPLLFIMISNHFPATYSGPLNWLVLSLLFVAGAAVRYAMIGTRPPAKPALWALAPAALALGTAMFVATPRTAAPRGGAPAAADAVPAFAVVRAIVAQRCQPCHSRYQLDRSFGPAPGGVTFDTPESIQRLAERIRVRAVETKTMPLANKTGITDAERELLGRWTRAGAPLR